MKGNIHRIHFNIAAKIKADKFKNKKISAQLTGSFLAVSAVTAIVMGMGIYGMTVLKSKMNDLSQNRMENLITVFQVMNSVSNIQSSARNAIINYQNPELLNADLDTFAENNQTFQENQNAVLARSAQWLGKLQKSQKDYKTFESQNKLLFDPRSADKFRHHTAKRCRKRGAFRSGRIAGKAAEQVQDTERRF